MKGYMGLESRVGGCVQENPLSGCKGGSCRLLGFASNKSSKKASTLWPGSYTANGIVADAMNNGGCFNPNQGRGQGGGAGRGNSGGVRWNGGVVSALAEATTIVNAVLVARLEKMVFQVMVRITKVAVLMVCSTGRNNDGGHGRFNNGYGFNRGNNRRNFNSQGNCNNRHFNNGYTGRDGNGKGTYVAREISNVSGSEGLTTAQALLVKEVVAVFAKQLAGMLQLVVQQGYAGASCDSS
jgi:hypothetical protein